MDTIETKTYYGEYTLEHWIKMLLDLDLVLPEYQRSFQWKKEDIKHFIDSLKDYQFIPPITIGSYLRNGQRRNYIIDGQQRLTALLLVKLGYYPNSEEFRMIDEESINENGDDEIEEEDWLEWTFRKLITQKTDILKIKTKCAQGHYDAFDCDVPNDFFTSRYMGFAYIVPKEQDETKHLAYFATVFRNINFQGIALSSQESRKALYYWNTHVTNWFDPPFIRNMFHNSHRQLVKLDFVRYEAFISQYYHSNKNIYAVFKGKRLRAEQYYEQYIYSVAQDKDDAFFGRFSSYFNNCDYQNDVNRLEQAMLLLGYRDLPFDNIVKLDVYLFGLIYYVVFLHKELNISEEQAHNLMNQLDAKIELYSPKHKNSPSIKSYIRKRINDSIQVFENYFPN